MKATKIAVAVFAVFLSVGTYAQSQPDVHRAKLKRSPEEQATHRAELKAKLAQMTPAERKAFKQAHRERQQARLNALTPEQRAKVLERRQQRKAGREAGK